MSSYLGSSDTLLLFRGADTKEPAGLVGRYAGGGGMVGHSIGLCFSGIRCRQSRQPTDIGWPHMIQPFLPGGAVVALF